MSSTRSTVCVIRPRHTGGRCFSSTMEALHEVENVADNGAPCPIRNIRVGRDNFSSPCPSSPGDPCVSNCTRGNFDNQKKRNRDKREDVEMFAEPGSFIYGLTLSDPASIVVARYLEAVTGSIPNWEVQLSSVVTTVTHYAPRREAPGLGKFKALSPLNSRLNPSLLSG